MRAEPTGEVPQVKPDMSRRVLSKGQPVEMVSDIRHYELITPLFGGGVEPGVNDPDMLIRGTSVRGQLRFWWRATRGGQFNGDLCAMKEAEDKLWGAASTSNNPAASEVQVEVKVTQRGQTENPWDASGRRPDWREQWKKVSYAAFPAQPNKQRSHALCVRTAVKFSMTLTFPAAFQADVSASLWAWETFGGIGARTRRGFGAVRCVEHSAPPAADAKRALLKQLRSHLEGELWPPGVPHLSARPRVRLSTAQGSGWEAWEHVVTALRDFRQFRPNGGRGPSQWPEPSAIRALSQGAQTDHSFPRSELGLPIVFHFKDGGDPDDTMLEGTDHDRLASPVIIRPLALANGRCVGMALVLDGTGLPPGGLKLGETGGRTRQWTVGSALTTQQAQAIPPLSGNTDVIDAFLKFLDGRSFQ